MKYKIIPYNGLGYKIVSKNHWYSKWKDEQRRSYWSNINDVEEYLLNRLNTSYDSVKIKKGKLRTDTIYEVK